MEKGFHPIPQKVQVGMFIIPYNTTLWVVAILVGAVIGFVIYGLIKGFDKTFPND
jgi:hypothetical protein